MPNIPNRTTTTNLILPAAAAIIAAATCTTPAIAQHAIGDGRALDANQQLNAGRFNPRGHDVMDTIRFQNSIVTGNAPRGLSFRGDAGYTAAGDFRASLGSNDLFTFRRDTAFTNPADTVRGTDALRYQFALTTGNTPPSILGLSSFTIDRAGVSPSPSTAPDVDRAARALRSTTDFLSERLAAPTILGYQADDSGRNFVVVASPLMGIRASEIPRTFTVDDPTTTTTPAGDTAQTQQTERQRALRGMPVTGFEARASNALPIFDFAPRLDTRMLAQRMTPTSQTHADVMDRIAERLAESQPATTGQQPQPNDIQAQLRELTQRLLPGQDQQETAPRQDQQDATPTPPPTSIAEQATALLDAIRASGVRVDELAPRASTEDPLFRRHISDGQRLLAASRYFDAEDSFVRALAVRPRDPMASAGRIHAQLGAGLYLSAALNLRLLIANHPELATLRFDEKLLPAQDRIPLLTAELRNQIDTSLSPGVPRDAALLLAYMGFQTERPDLIRLGLDVYTDRARSQPDKDLATFLRTIWLNPTP